MEPIIVANKYRIVDTLFQGELQNIYVAEDIDNYSAEQFIINEILDGSVIYAVKDVFNEDAKSTLKNFIDYFYENSNFYIVSSISSNSTLDSYLSSNNLRISDKMYLTENLLTMLIKLEDANRLLKYHLLNLENISVVGIRTIVFNLNMKFDKDGLYATSATIISKLGDVICSIFANTPQASLEVDKDNIPPAIAAIVRKCKDDSYSSIEQVYRDFRSSLLYSTFIDSSVNKMIMKNIHKAKRQRSLRPLRRLVSVLIIAALLAGGYYGYKNMNNIFPALGIGDISKAKNQIPIAKFSLSKSKVYVGDRIEFISESTDPDINDEITSYEWSVSKNDDMFIMFSREQNPSYMFDAEGNYVVSLIIKDSSGISSNAYKLSFTVYPKEEIPDDSNADDDGEVILK
jgi:hypothetical protein